jgi:hypothetical protein
VSNFINISDPDHPWHIIRIDSRWRWWLSGRCCFSASLKELCSSGDIYPVSITIDEESPCRLSGEDPRH